MRAHERFVYFLLHLNISSCLSCLCNAPNVVRKVSQEASLHRLPSRMVRKVSLKSSLCALTIALKTRKNQNLLTFTAVSLRNRKIDVSQNDKILQNHVPIAQIERLCANSHAFGAIQGAFDCAHDSVSQERRRCMLCPAEWSGKSR